LVATLDCETAVACVRIQQFPQPSAECQSLDRLPPGMALCCRLSLYCLKKTIKSCSTNYVLGEASILQCFSPLGAALRPSALYTCSALPCGISIRKKSTNFLVLQGHRVSPHDFTCIVDPVLSALWYTQRQYLWVNDPCTAIMTRLKKKKKNML
jgi:hypothetical protein